jgi:hypothetical protein
LCGADQISNASGVRCFKLATREPPFLWEALNGGKKTILSREAQLVEATERRTKYFEDYESVVDRHRTRGFEYEQEAIAYSTSALKVLSYLNGGGLLAMPTAVALFHASIDKVKLVLLAGAGCFVGGLLFVAIAQGCAFFTMAKRSESENHLASEQTLLLSMTHYPEVGDQQLIRAEATENRAAANRKIVVSNKWRHAGLLLFWLSFLAFNAGCLLGAIAILS